MAASSLAIAGGMPGSGVATAESGEAEGRLEFAGFAAAGLSFVAEPSDATDATVVWADA